MRAGKVPVTVPPSQVFFWRTHRENRDCLLGNLRGRPFRATRAAPPHGFSRRFFGGGTIRGRASRCEME
jgi:hypothetical protein